MSGAGLMFEIGCEELPADYIEPAVRQLAADGAAVLERSQLAYAALAADATPRRLVLHVTGLADCQPTRVLEWLGPRREQAIGPDGRWTPAGEGFLKKIGAKPTEADFQNDRVWVRREAPGQSTLTLLPSLLANLAMGLRFPKSMHWDGSGLRFARPIRWLLALYGRQVVPVVLGGVTAGARTRLHPQTTPSAAVVAGSADYTKVLRRGRVILSAAARRARITDLLDRAAARLDGRRLPDAALLETVTMMTEYPGVVAGTFDPAYLDMPREVVTTAMREHQRYFAVESNMGVLLPHFLAVYDNPAARPEDIRPGCERVLEARLKDAQFFYQEDLKRPLDELVERLAGVRWVKGLGTLLDKTRRLERMTRILARRLEPQALEPAERAARLAKADLASHMVQEKEFSALQGVMGGLYASAQGQPEAVARAVGEHYRPRGADDVPPETPAGRMLALADKLDHLVGCWGAGLAPTGAKDPYALRRAGQGILAVVFAGGYRLPLTETLRAVSEPFEEFSARAETVAEEARRFLLGRLESELTTRNVPPDVMQAVLGVWTDDLYAAWLRAETLLRLRQAPDFSGLVTTFSRVVNILPKSTPRDRPASEPAPPVDEDLLSLSAERELYADVRDGSAEIEQLAASGEYERLFRRLARRAESINRFFTDVLVMDPDPRLRENRLRLLTDLARQLWTLADFSRLVLNA